MVIGGKRFLKIIVTGLCGFENIVHRPEVCIGIALFHASDLIILTHRFPLLTRIDQNIPLMIPGMQLCLHFCRSPGRLLKPDADKGFEITDFDHGFAAGNFNRSRRVIGGT